MQEYMNYRFSWTGDKDCSTPLCWVCGLGYSAMIPAKLKRNFITKHENLIIKGRDYFDRLLITKNKQGTYFNKIVKLSDKSQITSYKIAELVAMKQQPHTIAKSHIFQNVAKLYFFSVSKMALII